MRGADDVVHNMDYSLYQLSEILNIIKKENIYHKLSDLASPMKPDSTRRFEHNKLLHYSGNYIRCDGRTILATAGPNNNLELNILLHHLLDGANPITQLIILIVNDPEQPKFCANYFRLDYPIQCDDYIIEKAITLINTRCTSAEEMVEYHKQCICTDFTVTAKLTDKKNILKIYSIPVPNGSSIVSPGSPKRDTICSEKNKPFIRFLIHNYIDWLTTGIVAVHCELGINRSAQLTMIYFLLADFERIFVPHHPARTVQNIEQKMNQIFSQRLGFCPNLFQFLDAIDITLMMKVALEKMKLQKNTIQNHIHGNNSHHLTHQMDSLSLWSRANYQSESAPSEKDKLLNKENNTSQNRSDSQTPSTRY